MYTYTSSTVLVEATGELAIGASGVFRPIEGGNPVNIYDLNEMPLAKVVVGIKGAHQQFKADIPYGLLDFGSTMIVAVSVEALGAAINFREDLEGKLGRDEAISYAALPPGSTITWPKKDGVWPERPTSRTDIFVAWKGSQPGPAIVQSGVGGMIDNVDYWMVTE